MTVDPLARVRWKLEIALTGGLLFVASLLYFVFSYIWRFDAPASLARGTPAPMAMNVALFTVFAMHHSLFARTGLKGWIKRTIPPELERSLYTCVSSVLFLITCVWWQPVPGTFWQLTGPAGMVLQTLQAAGGILTVYSARSLGVLQLAGITQTLGGPPKSPLLDDTGPYALVRHPIYFGWILFVWAAPVMNGTRLVFAALSTLYLALAVPFEERDLRSTFGPAYDDYRRRVRWKMIPFLY